MHTPESIENLKQRMAWEQDRSNPPHNFPQLPLVPPGRYTSEEFYALEQEHLWSKVWLYAAHRCQLPEQGSYLMLDIPGAPVFLIRGKDDRIRAFYNVCSHRGAPLVREPSGTERYFRCIYHQWTYNTEGELVAVMDERDFPEPFDKACMGLQEVRCELWGPWIFVNLDPHCEPLHDWLGMLVGEFQDFGIDKLRLASIKSYEVECNWKFAMDAFLEVYHIKGIHPKTVGPMLDHRGAVMGLLPNGHTRMTCPMNSSSRASSAPAPERETAMPRVPAGEIASNYHVSHNVFPNIITPHDPRARQFLMFWPLARRRTRVDVAHFGLDWGDAERPADWDPYLGFYDIVMDEDLQFLAWQQKAVEAPGFKGFRLSYMERRLYYAHESIDRMIGVDNVPEHLRVTPMLDAFREFPEDHAADPLQRMEREAVGT